MIDIHAHLLPGIDDGSTSMEMTLEMLTMAYESGVTGIVATPHANFPGMFDNYASRELNALFRTVYEAKEEIGIPIRLYPGMEVYATPDLAILLKEKKVWTLRQTNRFLVECAFDEDPKVFNQILKDCKSAGFDPVIAHPERYYFIQEDPEIAYEWCIRGYALQVNKGSLLGRFGEKEREIGMSLLRHGLCACVASDAHRTEYRTTDFWEVDHFLKAEVGDEYASLLTEVNPARILSGRELLGYEPIPYV